jgi:hypothetical protein
MEIGAGAFLSGGPGIPRVAYWETRSLRQVAHNAVRVLR